MRLSLCILRRSAFPRLPRILSLLLCLALPGGLSAGASPKHHGSAHAAKTHANAAHLARLAAQQKAAWREHLAKVKALPRAKRLAVKRQDRHFKRLAEKQHLLRLAQQQAQNAHAARLHAHIAQSAARHAKLEHLRQAVALRHSHPLAERRAAGADKAAAAHAARQSKLAAIHQAHLRAHLAAAAGHRSLHELRLAQLQAKHLQHLRAAQQAIAQRALAHQTRLARQQNTHAAHIAAQRARRVALHGDDSGGKYSVLADRRGRRPRQSHLRRLNDPNVKVSAVMARARQWDRRAVPADDRPGQPECRRHGHVLFAGRFAAGRGYCD